MTFGIGDLFDPFKLLQGTTNLFGGPQGPTPPSGGEPWGPIEPPGGQPIVPADKTEAQADAAKALSTPPGTAANAVGLQMLKAGDDDMRPPPMPGGTGNLPLLKAGGEGSGAPMQPPQSLVGMSRGLQVDPIPGTPGNPGAASGGPGLHPDTPLAPGATTPTQSPQYKPTPPQPGESPSTLHPVTAVPPPGAAQKPGATQGPGGIPTTSQRPGTTALDKLGQLGQGLQQAGAGSQGGKGGSPGLGATSAAFTPNGSAIMQDILKMHPVGAAGPVPGLPPGLLQRFRRGG